MKQNNQIYFWRYTPQQEFEDAYESIIEELQQLSQEYIDSNLQKQKEIIELMLLKIREINIFPIIYFSENGIKQEILSVYSKNDVCFTEKEISTQAKNGLLLLDYLFPNLHLAITCNEWQNMYERFYDDSILKRAIKTYLDSGKIIYNLRTLFFSYARLFYDTPINFSPMRAKAIYEHYCPAGGVIYDYSAGYGGRMLGALCSKQDYTYIAVEPNLNTYNNLLTLGNYIEKTLNRTDRHHIYNVCSEDFVLEAESVDFIFSCPPFFKKELYSDEKNQSTNKFSDYNKWLENYVRPTIRNSYIALKEQGVYGVDILNYSYCGKDYPLIEDWIRIAQEEGFIYKDSVAVNSKYRKRTNEGENIYLFMKQEEYPLPDYTPTLSQIKTKESAQKKARAKYRKEHRVIGEYDIFGNLLQCYSEQDSPVDKEIYKTNKLYNNKYYCIYYGEDIIKSQLEVKQPVCIIDDQYFFSLADAGRYLEISRQAVSNAKQRGSTIIKGKSVVWI